MHYCTRMYTLKLMSTYVSLRTVIHYSFFAQLKTNPLRIIFSRLVAATVVIDGFTWRLVRVIFSLVFHIR
jgi:hypothetical protein